MKSFMTACFFAFVATQIVQAQDVCSSQGECKAGQCCAGYPMVGSNCQNLTPEGGKCHLVDRTVAMFGDFIIGPCPCAEGLTCVQSGKNENDGICTAATTTAPEVSEEPAGDDTPVEEPAGDDTPVEEPAGDDTPAEETAGDDTPAEEPAGDDTPAEEPAGDSSAEGPASASSAEEPAGDDTPAEETAADSSAGESVADSSAAGSAAEA